MLCNLPTETIEQVLLNLSLRDLLETIRINRRLCAIAHNPKSRLKYRLLKRRFELRIEVNRFIDGISVQFTNLSNGCYRKIRFQLTEDIQSLGFCTDLEKIQNPAWIIDECLKNNNTVNPTTWNVSDSDNEAIIAQIISLLKCLFHTCAIVKINLDIENSALFWLRIASFFNESRPYMFCRPSLRVAKCKLDTDSLFSNHIFHHGLNEIKMHSVVVLNDHRADSKIFELLKTARYVSIYCLEMTKLSFDNKQLFTIFGRANYLELTETNKFTKQGITQLFMDFYEREQNPQRYVKIESFHCLDLEELLSSFPMDSKKEITGKQKNKIFEDKMLVLTGKSGQQWRIYAQKVGSEAGKRLTISIVNHSNNHKPLKSNFI